MFLAHCIVIEGWYFKWLGGAAVIQLYQNQIAFRTVQKTIWYSMNTYLIHQGLEEVGGDHKSQVKFPYTHESCYLLESFHESRD